MILDALLRLALVGVLMSSPMTSQHTTHPESASLNATSSAGNATCRLSEFRCQNGKCIPLSQVCNHLNECGDGSDELKYCTQLISYSGAYYCDFYKSVT
nr:PREDICTED: very low-density lipoprotein receptor-like [Bemisia tabaci]